MDEPGKELGVAALPVTLIVKSEETFVPPFVLLTTFLTINWG